MLLVALLQYSSRKGTTLGNSWFTTFGLGTGKSALEVSEALFFGFGDSSNSEVQSEQLLQEEHW